MLPLPQDKGQNMEQVKEATRNNLIGIPHPLNELVSTPELRCQSGPDPSPTSNMGTPISTP